MVCEIILDLQNIARTMLKAPYAGNRSTLILFNTVMRVPPQQI
jgi:hypothetical protein